MAQEAWQRAQRFWTSHQIALTLIQLSIHGLLCLGLSMLHVGWWISVLISRAENFCFYVSVVSPDLMSKWQIQLRDCTCIWQQPVSHMTGLLYWTRIYKVNFKFCNTLSNNMGKLFPQTKNLKKPLQIQTSALCWRPQNISTCPIYILYMTKNCFSSTTNFTQYLGGSFNVVADWLLLQLITLNENKLKQTRTQDFQISTDKQHQKRDWRTPSQTITWSHFSVAVA